MSKLVEVPFDVIEEAGRITTMMYKEQLDADKHWVNVVYSLTSAHEFDAHCSCGAVWVGYAKDNEMLQDKLRRTFGAHLSYFNRPKTQVD